MARTREGRRLTSAGSSKRLQSTRHTTLAHICTRNQRDDSKPFPASSRSEKSFKTLWHRLRPLRLPSSPQGPPLGRRASRPDVLRHSDPDRVPRLPHGRSVIPRATVARTFRHLLAPPSQTRWGGCHLGRSDPLKHDSSTTVPRSRRVRSAVACPPDRPSASLAAYDPHVIGATCSPAH